MRFLAVLTLLLQLQPVVGSVLCLHAGEAAETECSMPHEGRSPGGSLAAPAEPGGGCPSMSYCVPAAPAVPELAEHFLITSFVHSTAAPAQPSLPPGEPLGPPFHPPRA